MTELKDKILAKLEGLQIASLATITQDGKPWVRYVTVQADPDLTLYVATSPGSRKVAQVKAAPEVHLTCGLADPATMEAYLQIQGRAEVVDDQTTKNRVWRPEFEQYFPSAEDPNLVVVRISPYRIEYQTMAPHAPEVWEG
jgi:general stress protein 26